jgi:hypothetical protein
MINVIYSSNSNNAILKDFGPHKEFSSDNSMSGSYVFQFEQATKPVIIGNKIEKGSIQIVTIPILKSKELDNINEEIKPE